MLPWMWATPIQVISPSFSAGKRVFPRAIIGSSGDVAQVFQFKRSFEQPHNRSGNAACDSRAKVR